MGGIIFSNGTICNDRTPTQFYSNLIYHSVTSDRFGLLNCYSGWKERKAQSIPTSLGSDHSELFSDICDDQVERIVSTGKDIYISWSGGVDSSCIVACFMRHGFDKSRLHILTTQSGIEEYPYMYDLLVRDKIDVIVCNEHNAESHYYHACKDNVLVLGWCGDQLFGSDLNLRFPKLWSKDYRHFCISQGASSKTVEQFEEGLSKSGLPIKNVAQFFWWMNFSCKWNWIIKMFNIAMQDVTLQPVNFFEAEDFQRWAIARFGRVDAHHPSETEFYKWEMKDIIFQYTGDTAYRKSKGKIGSWAGSTLEFCRNEERAELFICDDDGLKIYYSETDVPYMQRLDALDKLAQKHLPQYRK